MLFRCSWLENNMPKTQVNTWASPKHSLQWWPDSLPSLGCPWWIVPCLTKTHGDLQKAPIVIEWRQTAKVNRICLECCMNVVHYLTLCACLWSQTLSWRLGQCLSASWTAPFCKLNRVNRQVKCAVLCRTCRFCLINHIDIGCSSGIGGLLVCTLRLIYHLLFLKCFYLPGMCLDFWAVSKWDTELPYKEWCRRKGATSWQLQGHCMLKLHCFCC